MVGWARDLFLAGYGAVQAVPGPLFTFSAYLGAAMGSGLERWLNALICVVAIFLPSFLLVVGILPIGIDCAEYFLSARFWSVSMRGLSGCWLLLLSIRC